METKVSVMGETKILDTELMGTKILDTELMGTKILDTELMGTKILDTELIETTVLDKDMETKVVMDTEAMDIKKLDLNIKLELTEKEPFKKKQKSLKHKIIIKIKPKKLLEDIILLHIIPSYKNWDFTIII